MAVKAGTPGIGVEMTARLSDHANLRLGFNTLKVGYSGDESDTAYDMTLDLRSGAGLLDWHPTAGAFRLTGGVVYDKNSLGGIAEASDGYTVGDTTYSPSEIGTLRIDVRVKEIAPYAGLGFGNAVGRGKRLSFAFDFGVIFQGSPNATLTATGPVSTTPQFQQEAAREVADINDEIRRFRYYPLLTIGLGFQF